MTEDTYRQIVARLERWAYLGERVVPNGARLIGHVPHVAPLAYLHQIFPGLSSERILQLETTVGRPIPEHYRNFLRLGNGISMFSKLSLDGLRFNYSRDPNSSRQPFHLKTPNINERPSGAASLAVFIGGYEYDGSCLFTLPHDGRIFHCDRREVAPILNTWSDLETMLNAEIDRFETIFDREGKLKDSTQPTVPAAGTYQ